MAKIGMFYDALKNLANEYGTKYSYSIVDRTLPVMKCEFNNLLGEMAQYYKSNDEGLISNEDLVVLLQGRFQEMTNQVVASYDQYNFGEHQSIIESGFRGSKLNLIYLCGSRGLVSAEKEFLVPVQSPLIVGYSVMEGNILASIRKQLIVKSIST
jgi:hypothetical protein